MNKLKKYVEEFGGTIVDDSYGSYWIYQIVAPNGKVWNCDIVHKIRMEWETGDIEERKQSINDAIERIKLGLCECIEDNCEFCNQ